ncbi:MAG TPA: non-ribosomal peptide synthase/polyketide synthase, partial [Longimicrobium sp.]
MTLSLERLALLPHFFGREGIRGPEDLGLIRVERTGELPLSFAQQRLWFLDQLEPGSAAYNVPVALRMRGRLDAAALASALTEVARRHEVLRTTFRVGAGGEPVQVIGEPAPLRLPVVDLSAVDAAAREAVVERLAREEAARPFDLARGPVLRCTLLRLEPAEAVGLFTMHHIVSDEWSVGLLVREVSALYTARARGEDARLPELPVQYADYAAWQRDRLQGELLERQLAYWRERLAGAPAVIDLPTDRPRPAVASERGARHALALSPALAARLREVGRREGATLFMTLLAAWQALLARYGAGEDVVVGTPVAGRTRLETEGLIGFFVNMLVIRTGVEGDSTFRELLGRVRENVLGAQAHQELPFERLVDELAVERTLAHTPLFQVMFTLQAPAADRLELEGLEIEALPPDSGATPYDLSLLLGEEGEGLAGGLEYRADLFDAATVARMAGHLVRLLEAVAADPDARLSDVDLLDEAERRRVVEEWNATERPSPRDRCVHELFERQVARTRGAAAVVYDGGVLTYRELNARANRLARYLRRMGVGAEVVVAICLERSPELIVAMLAVLKAGGAFLPLDPAYPRERLLYLLEDSGARVLLTDTALRERLGDGAPRRTTVVCLDEKRESIARRPAWNPHGRAGVRNLAYVIYTSGSTGRPKGVAVEHGSVSGYAVEMARLLELGEGERMLQFASPGFDVVIEEVFPALVSGAAVVVSRAELLEPAELARVVDEASVSVMELPTAYWHEWVRTLSEDGLRLPGTLRRVLMGGERVLPERLRAWRETGCELIHVFGLTETTVTTSIHRLPAGQDAGEGELPIGSPIANQRVYVLDAGLRPVPVGVPGEMYIGGEGVARGYLGRRALTAQRFVPDPFSADRGARLYRTGDRARWRADGELEFLGRADEQVKVRGYRIEPGEIESVLTGHPAVGEAVVVAREDVPGDRRLVAYVVARDGTRPEPGALRAHLSRRLPDYMVPGAFVVLDRIPLTPNGKVDRRALPAPEHDPSRDEAYAAPRTPTEEVLAGIWAEVLGLERVGVEENFFALGGHSLIATRVTSRAREAFRIELPLRALFEAQTVAGLAARVDALRGAGAGVQAPPVVPVPRDGELPLSFAQQRLWFVDQLEPGSAAYNIPVALRMRGGLDAAALAWALTEVVRRHEVLRTTFGVGADGRAVQRIAGPAPVPLPVVDLSALGEAEREAAVEGLAREEAARPFDLARGPVLRGALLRLEPREAVGLFTMHHIASDEWSVALLVREVSALYAARIRGEEARLPDLPVQYADYAVWQRRWLEGEVLDRQVAYWRRRLAGAPAVLELPTDRPRPAVAGPRGASHGFALRPELSRALRELGRREGATLNMALLAAWSSLLGRYGAGEDVVVGTPVAGRTRLETESLIGFFVNTLVIRTGLEGDPTFREVLARVREGVLEAQANQDVPFERLVEELEVERSLAHTPLFQVTFSLEQQSAGEGELRLEGTEIEPVASSSGIAKFDLALGLTELGDRVEGALAYREELFDAATVRRMAGHLVRLLEQVAADPDVRLSELELLDEGERRQVLEAWNPSETIVPEGTLHERFAEQAARTPHAPALTFGAQTLTYAELDERSGRLARRLRGLGVGPETAVALCVERSAELVVGILAILKAGGAYVPLDPGYPADRLRYTLEDARARVLLTQAALRARLEEVAPSISVVCLDVAEPGDEAESQLDPAGGAAAQNLAYVIYTSGSTGRPKGVQVTHGHVLRLMQATEPWFGFGGDDVWTLFHSSAFDFSVWEIWGALLYGGRLVVVPFEVSRAPDEFRALLSREGVTVLNQTPSAFRQLIEADRTMGDEAGPLALKWVIFGGEALSLEALRPWIERHGDDRPRLVNMYGITETTVHVTYRPIRREDVERGEASVIGVPIPDLRLYLLDGALRPVPLGVPGEIHVGGAGVSRGYLGRPALTAERFVPDPFGSVPGARLYRSGDLARRRGDGELEYLGRGDQQVKVRGFRIEPGEIERVLLNHPALREAVVTVREDVPGDQRLAAYLVPDSERAGTVGRLLRLQAGGRLAGHPVSVMPNGMPVVSLNPHETEFLYRELFEQGGYLGAGVHLPADAVVFDVGANIGLFTVQVARLRPGATVYAFEPIAPVFEVLSLNAELHGVRSRLFPCGIAERPGRAEFAYYPHASVLSGQHASAADERGVVRSFLVGTADAPVDADALEELLDERLRVERCECELRTLSDVIRAEGVRRIDLLKVDVEKSELEVLEGLADEHWPLVRQVVLEVHDTDGRLDRVRSLLESRGYAVAITQDSALAGTPLFDVRARRPEIAAEAADADPGAAGDERWEVPAELAATARRWCRDRLPDYMVPGAFVVLDALPLTPNGKVDLRALPAPEGAAAGRPYAPPRTAAEEVLAEIWGEVLGVERVGVDDNFFELGGHSLIATRVVSRARHALGVEVPLRAVFEAQTVRALAGRVEALRGTGEEAPPIVPAGRDGDLPLSFAQQRLWFIDRLEPGSAAYNLPVALRLRGELDAGALERALTEVARRHEVLRTTFSMGADGQAVQVVHAPAPVRLPVVDLSGLDGVERERWAERLSTEEASRPFDLARGPVMRCALLRLGAADSVVLFTLHHIASDGWSMEILQREVTALYGAYARGEDPRLPELPVQYADYAVWQRRWLEGEVLERQVAYWRDRLRGAPAVLELPLDRPRPAVADGRGASHGFALPAELSRALRELSRREGATLYMTLLAAWQALLARCGAGDDVVVGTPVAGRTRLETEGLIGFFVNTLVIRTGLEGDPTFRDLVGRVRERVLEAQAHQDVPFERLVDELDVERSMAHAPLFQVLFTFRQAAPGDGELRLGGAEIERAAADSGTVQFDLTLGMGGSGDRLAGAISYRAGLFDAATIERMAGHLVRLLERAAADPGARLSELELMDQAERGVLEGWNATERDLGADVCLHRLVEAQAARTPDAVAVVFEGEALSYRELDRRANQLAHHLRRHGVGPEVRVGICAERSPELVVALLGVLKAGGAYVPVDPGNPAERIAYILRDSAVPVLLTQARHLDRLPPLEARTLCLDAGWSEVAGEPESAPEAGVTPDHLAYVIYTSGSTGRPKGAMNAHRGVVNRLRWGQERYGLGAGDAVLQKTPVTFDVSGWEFYWPLIAGARLVLARPEGHRDPAYLSEVIGRERVTVVHFVPPMLRAFLEAGDPARCASVRRVFCSGEALPRDLVERTLEALPGAELHNLYGPTETAIEVTHHDCAPGAGPVPIGRPIANTRMHVLDAALRPQPRGVPGELFIAGVQVGRGYLGRPALTAAAFLPDPHSPEPGARMYRTGDRARWLSTGELQYLGRIDFQVKVRGFRIELGEIESVLLRHPSVREAVVAAREDGLGEKWLAAYVVAEPWPGVEALRAHLSARLPEYMVPGAVVPLDALPLSPNGKVDRRALPAPERAAERRYVAPRTAAEEVLAEIWGEVLGVERVGVEDNFFGLGGHSLVATRMVSRVREAFGVEVPLRAVFEAQTVRALAGRVAALRGTPMDVPPVVPVPRDRELPLSFAQRRLWFIDRLEPGSAAYNLPVALRLRGELDPAGLAWALTEMVRRHEVLRTTFAVGAGGEPVQVVHEPAPVRLPVIDLSAVDPARRGALVERLANEEAARPFDLARGPVLRCALLRLGDAESVVLFTMHHIAGDGWSIEILQREVTALYDAWTRGEDANLPELPVQYADHAVWQRRWLEGEVLDRQVAYWRRRLDGAPAVLELPLDHPRPATTSGRGASHGFALPPELSRALRDLGRGAGATPYMTLLAAWQALLARYGAGDDVVVGTPVAGRTRLETEGLIGFFVNTLVIRTRLEGDPTFREALARVREGVLEAQAHQDVPFERLVDELEVERSLSHTPLFQVLFTFRQAAPGDGELRLGGTEIDTLASDSGTAKFDLTLGMSDFGGHVAGSISYRAELFDAATVERMAGHFVRLLERAAAAPDLRLSELELLGDAERRLLLEAWNPAETIVPERTLHERFVLQAARTPDAPAVTFGAETLTYAELEERSGRLARRLRGMGVGPETAVALCVERSAELVVGILGVLKAGGAYVPLDPDYPADRLRYTLEDAGARVLLTQAALRARLEEAAPSISVVCLDAAETGDEAESQLDLAGGAAAENLAYVIYTSGSTGRPKGVQVTHGSVLRLMQATEPWFGFGESDVWTLFHSSAFDFSVWEIWGALLYGGRLVVVPFEVSRAPEEFRALLSREGVTVLNQTPSAFRQLIEADRATGEEAGPLALKWVIFGGEALSLEALRPWIERHGDDRPRLVNMYGITETTVHVTYRPITREDVERGEASVIGVPIPDLRLYLLDGSLRPVPLGVPGEIHVGGAGVARGYLGRPALTAERFVPDPYGSVPGARLYRSGDLARRSGDGELEYLGRGDQQVKVRGFRIEPGEIEAALLRHPGVREAVVLAREDRPGEKRLVAYVVADAWPGADALRAHLSARLPDYMVPGALVELDALPLTPSGKVDRRALPAPELAAERPYVAPRTAAEEVLAEIWSAVLGVERVGAEDNFFELGGHSLVATRVVSRARHAFGVELPLRAVFEAQTVRALAARVEALRGSEAEADAPPIVPVPREGELPLSFAQQRLWFVDQLEPGSAAYNIPVALRMRGGLDAVALAWALTEVVRRHEVLRTTFGATADGRAVQRIADPAPVPLPEVDLSALDEAEREAAVERLTREEAARPFDLARGPVLRGTLLRLDAAESVVLFTMHHIASDEWSVALLVREVSALYAARVRGDEARLPDLPVQYADYAAWQRERLRGELLERQLGYWRERLAGAPAVLELPADGPRGAVAGSRAGTHGFAVPEAVGAGLRALGRGEGATLFMTLLAAWQVLLGRYGAGEDIVVGTPVAGRTRLETEGLIGFFVNMLVIRTGLGGDPAFREVLGRVREGVLEAQAHQDVPFERLVDELAVERSLAHTPLFQVLFTLENADPAEEGRLRLPGIEVEALGAASQAARYDLTLRLTAEGDRISGSVAYRTDLFEAETIRRLAGHFVRLLEEAAAEPGRPLSRLELLGEAERRQLLVEWNETDLPLPEDRCVHEGFEEQARRTPHAVAVECEGRSLTYAELNRRANRLAHLLRRHGVRPDERVALFLERSLELVVGLLGVLKAGAAYLPLEVEYPPERVSYMLADSAVRVVLAHGAAADRLPESGCTVLRLDAEMEIPAPGADGGTSDDHDPRPAALPGNLAYVIYTSGSTGQPKGVGIEHRQILNYVHGVSRRLGIDGQASAAMVQPLTVDSSQTVIFPCLATGGRLHVVPRERAVDPVALRDCLRANPVDLLKIAPSHLAALQAVDDWRSLLPRRWLVIGGEGSKAAWVDELRRAAPEVALFNHYGPTETTVGVLMHRAGAAAPGRRPIATPTGRPLANTRVYVLDGAMEPVPAGVAGELYVGGASVARGYLGRPALTAERFVPDPFGAVPGGRLYRTGDRVRWRSDGELEFLGRLDFQVKIRGYRIEPGEIEAVLRRHPAVREAVVVAREDAPGDRRLAAYVVADGDPGAGALRQHAQAHLPPYMVPSAWVFLPELPRTEHGKLSLRALPAPDAQPAAGSVAPRTAMEETLAGIWAEVLGIERVGVHDTFFELGGDSILSIQVVARARRAGLRITPRQLFEHPTVAGLAEVAVAVDDRPAPGAADGRLVAPGDAAARLGPDAEDAYPLVPLQEGMLFHTLYEPGTGAYVSQFRYDLHGELDVEAFRRAWRGAAGRHTVLRTGFTWEGVPEPLQVVRREVEVPLLVEDWRGVEAGERAARLDAWLAADRARGFDPAQAPLIRMALFRTGEADHHLVWTHHHLVLDGWSVMLLLRDVVALYGAHAAEREPSLPPARPYRDYVDWLGRQDPGQAERYWREALAGFRSPTPLGIERAGGAGEGGHGHLDLRLGRAETGALQAYARRHGLTLNTLMQGAWALLLSRYSGEADVVFGATLSGRPAELAGVEEMVGLFINTLPARVRVAEEEPVADWLRRLQSEQAELREHEHSPLAQVQRWSEVPAGTPLFETILSFNNYLPGASSPGGEGGGPLRIEGRAGLDQTNYLLTVTAGLDDVLSVRAGYDAGRLDGEAVRRLLAHFGRALERIAASGPELRLSEIELLDDAERRRVLEEWSGAGEEIPAGWCLHERFAEQARRTPGAVAVECEGRRLTYAELDARAGRVARALRRRGVGPEERVGVCAERSLDLVVSLLAVLKAGAAYVPLDPGYPAERLAYMVADAGVRRVLAQGGHGAELAGSGAELLEVERLAEEPEGEAPADAPAAPDNLAYVIYTSGSTGRPKGVMITHRHVARLFAATGPWYGFGADDVWTLFHSFAFDFSVWEMWGALLHGGRLVVPSYEVSRTPEAFHALVRDAGVTVLNQTPSAFRQYARVEGEAAARGEPRAEALRLVVFGGEALEMRSLRPWYALREEDRPRLVNMYGITETTVHVTYRPLGVGDLEGGSVIGAAIPDLRLYVLDARLRPVPAGVPGELHVGGAGLARGYLGRPGLTAERFVPDPFRGGGGRLYRTGDRVRWSADGELEFVGRVDEQVKVRGFRIEPGEIEAVLAGHPAVGETVVLAREDAPGDRRLVAYVVGREGAEPRPSELRAHLSGRLPDYMVPSAFVVLDRMPLTPNGKVDRRALPAPEAARPEAGAGYAAPRTWAEEVLAGIWAEVLGVERVGVHDNFFELGGDSILSIQVVSRARAAGLRITPRQLFEHPTAAELAARAGVEGAADAEQGLVEGPVELTPIQRWFFDRALPAPHHWNMSVLFEVRRRLDPAVLERAVARVAAHHDALRMRFWREGGEWRAENGGAAAGEWTSRVDLAGLDEAEQSGRIEAEAERLQASLSLERGPLLRVVLFDRGAERSGRLLVVVHHLVMDGVSWRVLLEDLQQAYERLARGEAAGLPPKTTSFRRWAARLAEHVAAGGFADELPYWLAEARRGVPALPVDFPGGANPESRTRQARVALEAEETRRLLQEVPRAYRTQINDVLLAALARVLGRWTGDERVLVDVEGHGREEILDGVDLSRTVGWFTTIYPVLLDLRGREGEGEALKAVKEQLRAVPNRGIGHGALRWLGAPEVRESLAAMPRAEVRFEYMGQFDGSLREEGLLGLAPESAGTGTDPRGERPYLLVVNGAVLGGRLEVSWRYGEGVHRRETVEALAREYAAELRALVAHCTSDGAGGRTPSDFPLARLSQDEVDRVVGNGREVEDVYPLAPLQEGLLFHTLYEPGSGAYVGQFGYRLQGELDVEAFRRAWSGVVERHAALRTGFTWEGVREPLQVVRRAVEVPLLVEDWRGVDADEQARRLDARLAADRALGFDPARPPLMRLALFRTGDAAHHLVWTCHHLLLDGWSMPLVLRDVVALYGAHAAGRDPALPPAPSYRGYIAWLERQELGGAERYWRAALAGFRSPTPLGIERGQSRGTGGFGRRELRLGAGEAGALQAWARRHGLTVNTLVQGAWALLLSRYSGEADVVFGATVSGRPAELAGVDETVGLFINTLPVRVRVGEDERMVDWLRALQARQAELREHEHSPLAQVQRWSEVPAGTPLFETIFAFENYPRREAPLEEGGRARLEVEIQESVEQSDYPFAMTVTRDAGLTFRTVFDRGRYEDEAVARLLGHLAGLLDRIAASGPELRLADVELLGGAERRRVLEEWNRTEAGYPAHRCIHHLFEEQAERTPDAVAVVSGEESLTYRALDERANRL